MALFRKRPVVIDAIQVTRLMMELWVTGRVQRPAEVTELDVWWEQDDSTAVPGICGGWKIDQARSTYTGKVGTLEGAMDFKAGDWLIRGVAGELYPCKDEIFRATYEEVNEPGITGVKYV